MRPLSDNKRHLGSLCENLELGKPSSAPESVAGGFHHAMWDVSTVDGRYAVKQLAPDTDIEDPNVIQHFESTESVSAAFGERGLPALHALGAGDRAVQILDDCAYLVYPWTDAQALERAGIEPVHIERVAGIFARLHNADLQMDGLVTEKPERNAEEKLETLLLFAKKRNSSRHQDIEEQLPALERILEQAVPAYAELSANTVISHGDLDHKNVLWESDGQPLLIDWESAQAVNPTHELLLEALDWSGITLDFKAPLFEGFIKSYIAAGGRVERGELAAAMACVQADWVNWLMYNLGRSVDKSDEMQRKTGLQQVDLAMVAILHLQPRVPELLASLDGLVLTAASENN